MFERKFNYTSMILIGIIFIIIGISFIFGQIKTWNWVYKVFLFGLTSISLIRICNLIISFRKISSKFRYLSELLLWIILLVLCIKFPIIFSIILPRIIGIWIFAHAIVKMIEINIKFRDKLPNRIRPTIYLFWNLFLSFILIFDPMNHKTIVSIFVGIYFIIYGLNSILTFIREVAPQHTTKEWNEIIQLAVPPYIAAIIPVRLMKTFLDKNREELIAEAFKNCKNEIPIDLEILVHLAPTGPAKFGHMDMMYNGIAISYGCYDPHTRKLFGTMGDGVVIVAPRNSYIKNCLENEEKILVSFGLKLNTKQKKILNDRIESTFKNMKIFYSDEERKRMGLEVKGKCDDYISRVSRTSPGSHFYKFKEGKFKTFFVLSSNCVYFTSQFLSVIGLLLHDLSGIISPGAYYDFLNKCFKSDKSFVISRTIYQKKDAELFSD